MLLSESICQLLHYFRVLISVWLDDSHEEFRWDAESQNTIDKGSHDLKMKQSLEQFLKVVEAHVHYLDIKIILINLQLR